MKITMRLEGLSSEIGTTGVHAAKEISLEIPSSFDEGLISKLVKDVEILHCNTCQDRSAIEEICGVFNSRDKAELKRTLKKYGVDEESSISAGGGLLHLIIIAAILLYATDAY